MSKYDEVLKPFVAMMERELHANARKGDRPGWLRMTPDQAMLEIFYHMGKLQKAVKDKDDDRVREYAADVANIAMMLVDVCGLLTEKEEPRCSCAVCQPERYKRQSVKISATTNKHELARQMRPATDLPLEQKCEHKHKAHSHRLMREICQDCGKEF